MAKTAIVDIDGVIATGSPTTVYSNEAGWAYEKCTPIQMGIDMLNDLRKRGIRIVLFTARRAKDRKKTELWLKRFDVPHDELIMGKPSGAIYIDDNGYRFDKDRPAEIVHTEINEYMG